MKDETTRTLITVSKDDKLWLDRYSHLNHQSIAQTIRRAIAEFREQQTKQGREKLLQKTSGLWKDRDDIVEAQDYVNKLRSEWDERLE